MFNNSKYITRGISETIGFEIQILLWDMIESMNIEKDYLQIFDLIPIDKETMKIVHKQEVPESKREYKVKYNIDKKVKIFAIDSGTYSTMMLADEY